MATAGLPARAHHITHRRAPAVWQEGFPLGNGRLGVMLWGTGAPLCLTLDHADLWDLRADGSFMDDPDYNYAGLRRLVADGRHDEAKRIFEDREAELNPVGPTKISLGRAELEVGEVTAYECGLSLDRAVVEGALGTGEARRELTCFVHRDRDLVCLRVTSGGGAALRLRPLAELAEGWAALGLPAPTREEREGVHLLVQETPEGACCAIAWACDGDAHFLTVELAPDRARAADAAVAAAHAALAVGFDELLAEHLAAWEGFWAGSAVCLPEARMEVLWYLGVYLLASCSRPGSCPPGLQGVWAMDGVLPPWRGDYHADMNVQEQFWPACCSGHLELLDTWCDHMRRELPLAQEFTRRFFGTEGVFWPCTTLPGFRSVHCWATVEYAWSSVGWLAWLVWMRWRYSMDVEWLRETGHPIVSEVFRFYRANLAEGEDGRLHVPLSSSPEYHENKPEAWCSDPAIDIALIRRCCDWLEEMGAALGNEDSLPRELRERLAPYPVTDAQVLCLWPGKPLDESHRHPSHLMAVHPAMDLTIEGGEEERAIIQASVEQFLSLGQYMWAGHTYAQFVSLAAVIGRAGLAYDCLRQFAEHWIGPNGLHFNADLALSGTSTYRYPPRVYGPFTFEANCGVAAGIGDMLVQGWGDRLRVFPAVPEHWREVAFRDLLTEGAFRVSAVRREGKTVWVQVRATVDRELRLRDPFGGEGFAAAGRAVRKEGEDLVADLRAGQALTVTRAGFAPELLAEPTAGVECDPGRLGLR